MNESLAFGEQEIDSALRAVGSVEPRFGFEQRLLTRVAAATHSFPVRRGWFAGNLPFRRGVKIEALLLAASIVGAAVLLGSATHKVPVRVPIQQNPVLTGSRGFGAASVAHSPNQRLHSPADGLGSRGRGRGRAGHGRAIFHFSPTHRAHGTAAPDSPYPHPE